MNLPMLKAALELAYLALEDKAPDPAQPELFDASKRREEAEECESSARWLADSISAKTAQEC